MRRLLPYPKRVLNNALGRRKHREGYGAVTLVLPGEPHTHAALHVVDRIGHADDVGHHTKTFVEVNVRQHIRSQLRKGRVAALHDDAEGIHRALTPGDTPGGVERAAGGTMAPGIEDDFVAGVARLIGKLVAFGGLPEGLRIRFGEAWLWSWSCHTCVSPHQALSQES